MKCPGCGSDVPVSAGRCPGCSSPLRSAVTGVLTPPPDDAATSIGRHGAVEDLEQTYVSVPAGGESPDDLPTLLPGVPRQAAAPGARPSGDDPGQTYLPVPGGGEFQDDLVTLLPGVQRESTAPGATVPGDDAGPLRTGQTFGPRYHIIRTLGVGGMGAVYQAWDAELGEAVAIKVIRPEVMANPGAAWEIEKRFKRELLLARQVTHKNVVRIHDLGEIDKIKYITMSYVEGTDLATVLKQEGTLSVARSLSIMRPIVSGLIAAHAAGVVHRDLKPANIMVPVDGEPLIMDFGIARSTSGPPGASKGGALPADLRRSAARFAGGTMAGTVVGTVQYMAPEQAKGEEVDQRADIYALGLIVYDMLAGRHRASHSASALDELEARIEKAPPSIRSIVPAVPEAVNQLLSRCLEPDAAKRYQTTTELAADLDQLDDDGVPRPIKRVIGLPLAAAMIALLAAVTGGAWWYTRQAVPAAPRDPLSVLIADFQNNTGDPTFDGTLEPVMKLALEGADFISAYDRSGIARIGVSSAPTLLDERTAQEIAVKQAVGVVLSGSLTRRGSGYAVSMRATQPVTGEVITAAEDTASDRQDVLAVSTSLATTVRRALGDDTSDAAQRFAMETLSATSLDAVHDYAIGQQALSNNDNGAALKSFSMAVERDPAFGAAYSGMAIAYRNMGEQQSAEKYANEAVRHIGRMTERERYRARGLLYYLTSDYQACVKEYGDLITRYAGDVAARNNLALCLTYLREMPRARDEMQSVVKILPRRALYRLNLALYASYGSDFTTGEAEGRTAQELGSPLGPLSLAFAQLGQGQLPQATQSYQALGKIDAVGASRAASGLGDLAAYEGRFSDAARILGAGAAADVASKSLDRAAAKFAALAYARLADGQNAAAIRAADSALERSQTLKIRFLAARIFVEAGQLAKAEALAKGLASALQVEPQALAKVIQGNLALKRGDARGAITLLTEAVGLQDSWIGRFDLGRAYLAAGALLQADSEFDRCIKRRGEALSLFLDEEPTYSYLPPVYYYQGRVREGLKSEGFADSYRAYLSIRGKAGEDPTLPDVRRRAGP